VLGTDHRREFVAVFLEQSLELEHDARAAQRRGVGPAPECGMRCVDRAIDLGRVRQADVRAVFSRRRVVHRGVTAGIPAKRMAVDEMSELAHGR
jgi:hypothetical protein